MIQENIKNHSAKNSHNSMVNLARWAHPFVTGGRRPRRTSVKNLVGVHDGYGYRLSREGALDILNVEQPRATASPLAPPLNARPICLYSRVFRHPLSAPPNTRSSGFTCSEVWRGGGEGDDDIGGGGGVRSPATLGAPTDALAGGVESAAYRTPCPVLANSQIDNIYHR